eukprot:scaffold328088_cov36-Prasinocladus_malaysianus.AAC.1
MTSASSSTQPLSTYGPFRSNRSPRSYLGMPKGANGMMKLPSGGSSSSEHEPASHHPPVQRPSLLKPMHAVSSASVIQYSVIYHKALQHAMQGQADGMRDKQ